MKSVLTSKAVYVGDRLKKIAGKSTDSKPLNVANGSRYIEVDTGDEYIFDEEAKQWNKIGNGGGGETGNKGFFIKKIRYYGGSGFMEGSAPGSMDAGNSNVVLSYGDSEESNTNLFAGVPVGSVWIPIPNDTALEENAEYFEFNAMPDSIPVNPASTDDLLVYAETCVELDETTGEPTRYIIEAEDTSYFIRFATREDTDDEFEFTDWQENIIEEVTPAYQAVFVAFGNKNFTFDFDWQDGNYPYVAKYDISEGANRTFDPTNIILKAVGVSNLDGTVTSGIVALNKDDFVARTISFYDGSTTDTLDVLYDDTHKITLLGVTYNTVSGDFGFASIVDMPTSDLGNSTHLYVAAYCGDVATLANELYNEADGYIIADNTLDSSTGKYDGASATITLEGDELTSKPANASSIICEIRGNWILGD